MPHRISSQSFFIRLVSILSMFERQNRTLSVFSFFHYFAKRSPLAKSKWDLKIHSAMTSYHTRGIYRQEIIGMNNFAKEAGINNPEIAR